MRNWHIPLTVEEGPRAQEIRKEVLSLGRFVILQGQIIEKALKDAIFFFSFLRPEISEN